VLAGNRRTEDVPSITLAASTAEIIATHLSSIVLLFSLLVFVFFFSLYPVSFPLASNATVINASYSFVTSLCNEKGTPNGQAPHLVSCTYHCQILLL
jgi:hypothetical protein